MKKKNLLFAFILAIFAFYSCSNELTDVTDDASPNELAEGTIYPSFYKVAETPMTRVAAHRSMLWEHGQSINVHFVAGTTTAQKNLIKSLVKDNWQEHVGVNFQFETGTPDVIIQITNPTVAGADEYNWSYLGVDNQNAAMYGDVTMNLVLKPGEEMTNTFKSSVLLEFGHVLGLIYEYQRSQVIATTLNISGLEEYVEYEEVNGNFNLSGLVTKYNELSVLRVNSNTVGDPLPVNHPLINNKFDPSSIMMPYYDNDFIVYKSTGKNVLTGPNTKLSPQDIAYVSWLYPKPKAPDYVQGKTSKIKVSTLVGRWGGLSSNFYGVLGWDFINNRMVEPADYTTSQYNTIGVGEYEWMSQNITLRYYDIWSTLFEHLNHTPSVINRITGTNMKPQVFEKAFGTWLTEHDMLRNWRIGGYEIPGISDVLITRGDGNYEQTAIDFDLPTEVDILQMIGQMPRKAEDLITDVENFLYGLDASDDLDNATKDMVNNYGYSFENISGLNQYPMGTRQNGTTAEQLLYIGKAFGWKLKDKARTFYVSRERNGVHFNGNDFHYTNARYCRKMSPEELGYDLYVRGDKVVKDAIGGYNPIPNGLERGIALRYMENGIAIKSWDEIQKEAKKIREEISFPGYPSGTEF